MMTDTTRTRSGTNALNGMVQVVAPMDLPAGYQLEVDVNGQKHKVSVPAGGVKKGRSFQAQPMGNAGVGVFGAKAVAVADAIPVGSWRVHFCDAMCCLGFWCTPGKSVIMTCLTQPPTSQRYCDASFD